MCSHDKSVALAYIEKSGVTDYREPKVQKIDECNREKDKWH